MKKTNKLHIYSFFSTLQPLTISMVTVTMSPLVYLLQFKLLHLKHAMLFPLSQISYFFRVPNFRTKIHNSFLQEPTFCGTDFPEHFHFNLVGQLAIFIIPISNHFLFTQHYNFNGNSLPLVSLQPCKE